MSFEIRYHSAVVSQDIPNLSKEWKDIVKDAIENKLAHNPDVFGKPLRHSLRGYRSLRIEDYRVVFSIEEIVKVIVIQHRSVAYKILGKRIP